MSLIQISNGAWFKDVPRVRAADMGGTLMSPLWILIHYTGGAGRGAIGTLTNKDDNYVSAHTFTDPLGAITQMVPFDRQAYHAGASEYSGRKRLNAYTFGLELANPGYKRPGAPADWPTIKGAHKWGGPIREWYTYPDEQIESVALQCASLISFYGSLRAILGHEDVASPRGRKLDPGPAFPWAKLRARVEALLVAPPTGP
jgi:N-acetylmuramoyl-L-alanine amidase